MTTTTAKLRRQQQAIHCTPLQELQIMATFHSNQQQAMHCTTWQELQTMAIFQDGCLDSDEDFNIVSRTQKEIFIMHFSKSNLIKFCILFIGSSNQKQISLTVSLYSIAQTRTRARTAHAGKLHNRPPSSHWSCAAVCICGSAATICLRPRADVDVKAAVDGK